MIRRYIEHRRQWRTGWSQAELARAVGISAKHMCQVVTGAVPLTISLAIRIEQATDGDLDARELLIANLDDELGRHRAVAGEVSG